MHYDQTFQAWRYVLRRVGRELLLQGRDLSELQREAVHTLAAASADATVRGASGEVTKEQDKAAIQSIKKKASGGNRILLCPLLMHKWNFFNMRLRILVGKFLWSEQAWLSTDSADEGRVHRVRLARGAGEAILVATWEGAQC